MPPEPDSQPHWYVADVNPRIEKKVVDILLRDGIECFVPVQKPVDISGKKPKVISMFLSPGLIYVHCTESQRRSILQYGSFIRRFVGNGSGGPKIIAYSDMDEYNLHIAAIHPPWLCARPQAYGERLVHR